MMPALLWVFGCDEEGQPAPPGAPPPLPVVGTLNTSNGLPDNDVWNFTIDSQNQLWVATNAGVAVYDAATLGFACRSTTFFDW